MFLTEAELFELTKKTRHDAQHAVLNALGIEHRKRPDGSLVVSKKHVEQVFGVIVSETDADGELDWSDTAHA